MGHKAATMGVWLTEMAVIHYVKYNHSTSALGLLVPVIYFAAMAVLILIKLAMMEA